MSNLTLRKYRVNIRRVAIALAAGLTLGGCAGAAGDPGGGGSDPAATALTIVAFACAALLFKHWVSSAADLARQRWQLANQGWRVSWARARTSLLFTLAGTALLVGLVIFASSSH